ncbi:hypothetical protein L7F22_005443 [Adiantum nelumboides]|nr:hypothetical protein [Adiantum nelumboides]
MEDRDIIFLTETHESPGRGLPRVQGYVWESTHRKCMRKHTTRGSEGVAVLYKHGLQDKIQILVHDPEACFMWIRVELHKGHFAYNALCYFAPSGERFATVGEDTTGGATVEQEGEEEGDTLSPYTCLTEKIMEYSSLGEIFLMGDFNGQTQSKQCETYDFEDPEALHPLDEVGVDRISTNTTTPTAYGRHLLHLGSQHRLVIYNGMAQWPGSGDLTCIPPSTPGGGSTVDYIMGSREASHMLTSLTIQPTPIGADHSYITLSLDSSHTRRTVSTHYHTFYPCTI